MNPTMIEPRPTILVIEDEPSVRKFLRTLLSSQRYDVVEATNASQGVQRTATDQPDLIILDLGLPDLDGVELTRRIREWSTTPILVVSARGKEQEKVIALDAGADDYVTKPFSVPELLARIRVALRHIAAGEEQESIPVFDNGQIRVDFAARTVTARGATVRLTRNEYKLLTALIKNVGKVLTHQQLLKEVRGAAVSKDETHYVRVYMNQLRRKLEEDSARPQFLLTEPGLGYRLQGV